ncbi:MAG TPA: hypothetical protein VFE65_17490 [Pseudonocardia sp.]|jgi:hypothetical protein|nr:hypothetical protein [Pseudonocardia sp.]
MTTDWHAPADSPGLHLAPDDVLRVRAGVLAEADRLGTVLARSARVGLCGGDPLSRDARDLFNARIDGIVARCLRYQRVLRDAADSLAATTDGHRGTDADIAAAYRVMGGSR